MPRPLLPVDEALARVLNGVEPLEIEVVGLADALGRVLAIAPHARRSQPPFSGSAMDGYAVRGADATAGAELRLIGESAAGHAFAGTLGAGETVRIFTGAPLPEGADAVLIQEDAEVDGNRVRVVEATTAGRHVRGVGIDFREAEAPLQPGRVLSPRDLGLAAAMGFADLHVRRRPRVAVLATGDELVPPGEAPGPHQIIASSAVAISGLVAAEGGAPIGLGIVRDDPKALEQALAKATDAGAEVLVTLGGASVGDYDLVQEALKAWGATLDFWQIAMRPGKPMMFGRHAGLRILGLPGNPVSTHVCAILFLRPLLRALLGRPDVENPIEDAVLGADVGENDRRQDYLRARLVAQDEGVVAVPFPSQDSSLSKPLALADCLVIRPPFAPAAAAGEPCRIIRLDSRV
ncbi:MAG TPA: gephyrin-like molybdotransferase Glp [Hyphomicrobiales bacterium]|nr:gephyrin-like molybdotransferase Glp [Hyphomicrobiales bacterium]